MTCGGVGCKSLGVNLRVESNILESKKPRGEYGIALVTTCFKGTVPPACLAEDSDACVKVES